MKVLVPEHHKSWVVLSLEVKPGRGEWPDGCVSPAGDVGLTTLKSSIIRPYKIPPMPRPITFRYRVLCPLPDPTNRYIFTFPDIFSSTWQQRWRAALSARGIRSSRIQPQRGSGLTVRYQEIRR